MFYFGNKPSRLKINSLQHKIYWQRLLLSPFLTTQLIRIAKRTQDKLVSTQSYRLIVREIIHKTTQPDPQNLNVALQASLPIFMQPFKEQPKYRHRIISISKQPYLEIFNEGSRPILITGYKIRSPDTNAIFVENKIFKYVLPNAQFQFALQADVPTQASLDLMVY